MAEFRRDFPAQTASAQAQYLKVGQLAEFRRDFPAQFIVAQPQLPEVGQPADLRRNRTAQTAVVEAQAPQLGELTHPRRNLAAQVLPAQDQHAVIRDALAHPSRHHISTVVSHRRRCLAVAHGPPSASSAS